MLSRVLKGCLSFTFRYASFFRVVPYEWDRKTEVLSLRRLGRNYVQWLAARNVFLGHLVWIYFNTWRVFTRPGETVNEKMNMIFWSAAYSIPAIFHLTLTLDLNLPLLVINSTIRHFKNFEKLNWKREVRPPTKTMEVIIVLLILTCVTQPYFIHILYFSVPTSKSFVIPSLVLEPNSPFYLIFLGMFPTLWLCTMGWGACMFAGSFGVFLIYVYLLVAGQLRSNCGNTFTRAHTREPFHAFMGYRALQLLVALVNEYIQSILLIIVDLLMALVVVSNFVLIVFHQELPLAAFAVFGGYSLASTGSLFLLYIKLGQIHESSKRFVSSWKLKMDYVPGEKKHMLKCVKSCRLNRVEMGSVGYFQKPNSIRIVAKIIFYTTKFLMVMRPKA